jgi:hypothetical protein
MRISRLLTHFYSPFPILARVSWKANVKEKVLTLIISKVAEHNI